MKPITGSAEVCGVIRVWLFMHVFSPKTQTEHAFQRLSPWWTHVSKFLEENIQLYSEGGCKSTAHT